MKRGNAAVSALENRPPEVKSPIQVLRERRGGVPRRLVERNREQMGARRKLVEALRPGPKTVLELAQATGLPCHQVFWHLMAMRKYGAVSEGEERNDYFLYSLIDAERAAESRS
jgi:predicted Rossmann fold nucleotide-binding protein DprA/Smf involved in DNA uptake